MKKAPAPMTIQDAFQITNQEFDSTKPAKFQGTDNPDTDKAYTTLRAQFALQGHTLHRTSPTDGAVTYYAQRWGLVRNLHTLDDARRFLAQIGGVA